MENIDKEFRWVLKVLDSSTTLRHIKTSENLFNLFLKKHSKSFKSLGKKDIYKSICKEEFRSNMKEKIREVQKI